ncbi:MAG: AMP-binding protein [Planctomycetes bacterium]|nr:AMP-binding protein [Planctomycetota bacterium]
MTISASPQNNVISLLPEHVTRHGDKLALAEADPARLAAWKGGDEPLPHRQVTWSELARRVELAAGGLRAAGLEPGDRAVIFIPMSIELYVAMCAVFRIGAVAVFLDSFARQHQLGMCSQLVEPKAFLGDPLAHKYRPMLPPLRGLPIQVVTGDQPVPGARTLAELEALGKTAPIEAVRPDTTALVTFTTGSSGVPKGANRTHSFLLAQHTALDKHIPYRADDVDVPAFPIFLLNNLAAGISTIMPAIDLARPAESDPPRLVAQMLQQRVTNVTMSPALLGRVATFCIEKGIALGIRRLITGGAPVGPALVRDVLRAAPQCDLAILYGSTEAEPIADIHGREMLELLADPANRSRQGVCVGGVVPDLSWRLVKVTRGRMALGAGGWADWDVPAGQPGELLVAGEHVCRDYYRNEDATNRNKIKEGGKVWHRTGDVGYVDDRRRLWLVGRVHNAIVRAGAFHFPVEAEQVLKGLPYVKQAAFLGLPDAALGERTVAAFVPNAAPASPADAEARLAGARAAIMAKNFPVDEVLALETIPMDPRHHSKVDYDKLRVALLEARGIKGVAVEGPEDDAPAAGTE